MISESAILNALKVVNDPDLKKDIVSLGFVKDLVIEDDMVSFSIELTTPACPVKEQMREEAESAVLGVKGVKTVNVNMTATVRPAMTPETGIRLDFPQDQGMNVVIPNPVPMQGSSQVPPESSGAGKVLSLIHI